MQLKNRTSFKTLIGNIADDAVQVIDKVLTNEILPDPKQPRKQFVEKELLELQDSIAEVGILQPIVIRPADSDAPQGIKYYINYGEKRWQCAKRLKLETVPVTLRQNLPEFDTVKLFISQIAENTVRSGLMDGDFILAMCKLKDLDPTLSQTMISRSIGVPISTISNAITIGKSKYAEELIQLVDKGAAFRAIAELARLIKKEPKIWEQVSGLDFSMFTIDFVDQLRQTNELGKKTPKNTQQEQTNDNDSLGDNLQTSGTEKLETTDNNGTEKLETTKTGNSDKNSIEEQNSLDGPYTETSRNGVTNLDFVGDENGLEGGFSKRPVTKAAVNVMVSYRYEERRFMGRLALEYKPTSPELIPVINEKDQVQMVSMVDVEITLIGYE